MTAQHAIVQYPVNATRAQKIAAMYAGLVTIAVRLLVDYGQPPENVYAGLDRARAAAGESAARDAK